MKRFIALLLCLTSILLLPACEGEHAATPDSSFPTAPQTELPDSPPSDSVAADNGAEGLAVLFETENIPVASCMDCFIVRNESGNLYGLVRSDGTTILPCTYEKISFCQAKSQVVLTVKSKGSYGVFDLNGTELIPCQYTDIQLSPFEDSCIVRTFTGETGVIDFNNNIILPITFYETIEFGYGKIIAVWKKSGSQSGNIIEAYDSTGHLVKEFSCAGNIGGFAVGSGGNLIEILHSPEGSYRYDFKEFAIEGPAVWGDTRLIGEYILYFKGSDLMVRNINTNEEKHIWTFPDSQPWDVFQINQYSSYVDPISNIEYVDLVLCGGSHSSTDSDWRNLRVTLGGQFDVLDYHTLGLPSGHRTSNPLGMFYDGIAMVFPERGYLYTINTSGEKVSEVTVPYTVRSESFLLKNAAVLNNNGYFSIVDPNGNALLSDDGYSSVKKAAAGAYIVTDHSGSMGLINDYAEELIPCGEIASTDGLFTQLSNDVWELESTHAAEDELYVLNNGDTWAIYSTKTQRLCSEFKPIDGEYFEQYNAVLGNDGFLLMDESGNTAYLVTKDASSYSVSSYLQF